MLALSLCKELCANKIPISVGPIIGYGANGDVHEIINDPNKAIKLCKLFDLFDQQLLISKYKKIETILNYIKSNHIDTYARVHDYGYLGTFNRSQVMYRGKIESSRQQEFILYYYIMEKLLKISDDEKKIFHSILSHEDRGIIKNYSPANIKKMLDGMSLGLDFDMERVIFFCENLNTSGIKHNDLHARNILKNINGEFKLIDFDECTLTTNDKGNDNGTNI